MSFASFRFPTKIVFGAGSIDVLSSRLSQEQVSRPLVVTDKSVAQLKFFRQIVDQLALSTKVQVFSGAHGNPTESQVKEGVQAFKDGRCDSMVIVGGGCALDVGKAIGLMAHHPGLLFDYEDDKPGALPIDSKKIPFTIAIPTTAGTGSEVGGSSVISDDTTHAKVIVWGSPLIPSLVIADPALTIDLPPSVTAATGIDALTHNIEAFLAKNYHPICEGIALQGVRMVAQNLVTAVKDGKNLHARGQMLMASMMGAIAFQKGLGVTHSCAHALSTCFDMHHGLANAMMIQPCLRFNSQTHPEAFVTLAQTVGILTHHKEEAIQGFFSWLETLLAEVGIPKRLAPMGVQITERLLDVAFKDVCHQNNPRVCVKEDFDRLFQQAL